MSVSLNAFIGAVMALDAYREWDIGLGPSKEECYLKELKFSFKGHYSFSLHLAIDNPELDKWSFANVIITLKRVAPDWEPDSDLDEAAYNYGDIAEDTIREALSGYLKSNHIQLELHTVSRWSHRDLCNFYPDSHYLDY